MMNLLKKGLVILTISFLIGIALSSSIAGNPNDNYNNIDKYYKEELPVSTYIIEQSSHEIEDGMPDRLDQAQEYGDKSISTGALLAQSFTPTLKSLTRIELLIRKSGDDGGVNVSIAKSLKGPTLTYKYIPIENISSNAKWIEFDFENIDIDPGEKYYIIWEKVRFDSISWSYSTGDRYYRGDSYKKEDKDWEDFVDYFGGSHPDFCFRTYGFGPLVNITSPNDEEIVEGEVSIQGDSWGYDSQIEHVEVKIDDGSWNVADGTTTWNFDWDTTSVSDGFHNIYSKCYDGRIYSLIESISVYVDNYKPSLSIKLPESGFGNLTFQIENNGDDTAIEINWSILVKGLIFSKTFIETNGSVNNMEPQESTTIVSDEKLFGFDLINIQIILDAENTEEKIFDYKGLLLGPFFIILK